MFIGGINIKIILKIVGICLLTVDSYFVDMVFSETFPLKHNNMEGAYRKILAAAMQSNYQSEQAKIAIATGGIIGKAGNSTQRAFLPRGIFDFIYAIIIEEYGLLIGFVLLFLYMILLFGIKILRDNDKPLAALSPWAYHSSLVFQAL